MKKIVGIGMAMLLLPWLVSLLWASVSGNKLTSQAAQETLQGTETELSEESETSGDMEESGTGEGSGEAEASADSVSATPLAVRKIIVERSDTRTYMDVEDYLPGVIVCQIDQSLAPEALKCQAVIARTYIYRIMDGRTEIAEEELDLDYLEEGQKTRITDKEKLAQGLAKCKEAAEATKGVVMKYEDRYLLPLFHRASAGRTRTGEDNYPYLQSVESRWDAEREDFLSVLEWDKSEFAQKLNSIAEAGSVKQDDLPSQIQIVKKDDAGYVLQLQIGAKTYQGEEVQYALGLPSACYSFDEKDGKIVASVKGNGHGYGLSQVGADAMAVDGWNYQDILNYYYKNISVISE